MTNDEREMQKDHDKSLPITVSIGMVMVAVSALFVQILALRDQADLEYFWSSRLLLEVHGGRHQAQAEMENCNQGERRVKLKTEGGQAVGEVARETVGSPSLETFKT